MQHGKNLKVLDSLYPSGLGVIDPNFQKKIEINHFFKKKKKKLTTMIYKIVISRGGAMWKGGGPWPPKILKIYIIILMSSKFSL